MNRIWVYTAAAAISTGLATPAMANSALAQKSGCMACHTVAMRMAGPAFKDVARKYAGKRPEELAKSIKAGGPGKWGPVPMPPQTALSDADAKTLAAWIIAGAK